MGKRSYLWAHHMAPPSKEQMVEWYGPGWDKKRGDVLDQYALNRERGAREIQKQQQAAIRAADKHARANPPQNALFRLNAGGATPEHFRRLMRLGVTCIEEYAPPPPNNRRAARDVMDTTEAGHYG